MKTLRLIADPALAGGFLTAMLIERVNAGVGTPTGVVLTVLIAGAVAARRRLPLTAYAVGSAALSVEALYVHASTISPYANLIGLYSVGLYASKRLALLGPVIVLAGMVAYFAGLDPSPPVLPVGVLFFWLLSWALGYATARRHEERETARRLLREQIVADERARIARELHDLVGHTLTLMLVQVGAARTVLDHDPAQTRTLLTAVEHTGREALDELDRVLGVLRSDDGQPGLTDLTRLAARMEQAGLRVTVSLEGIVPDLPPSLGMSAYRVVQEALTNTVRHAQAHTAQVRVRQTGHMLEIEVLDDGLSPSPGYIQGRGLLGVAERVAMFGGTLSHGPGADGGFRVRAVFPVASP